MPELGDKPIEPDLIEQMSNIARGLDRLFNGGKRGRDRDVGFILLVFPFGEKDGRCNYISNGANRRDVVVMMKEQIKRFEGQPEMKGRA
jgi:hypothetical protein